MVKRKIKTIISAALVLIAAFACVTNAVPRASAAADSLALTITPPLFELNLNPGDTWSSSIKAVNTNESNLVVTGRVMGFAPSDEEGHGTFANVSSLANDPGALANWITISRPRVDVRAGAAGDLPFTIAVPKDASPGGHYAAILVGTEPDASGTIGSHVGVSSFISSLIFVRVAGDVKEEGSIVEFSASENSFVEPDVPLTLRFQNSGNVHLRPVGEIEIYNAWGKERGKIDVNQSGDLGYVLPSSTRRFDFEWRGESSLFDIGPYTAVVTLAYGENGSKSVSRVISFWILPVWKLAGILFGTLFFIVIFFVAIRRYIKRALNAEMGRYGAMPMPTAKQNVLSRHEISKASPVIPGVVDLRNAGSVPGPLKKTEHQNSGFGRRYLTNGILFILVLLGILWVLFYIKDLFGEGKSFEVRVNRPGAAAPWVQGISGKE